jgi:hypothetical protein
MTSTSKRGFKFFIIFLLVLIGVILLCGAGSNDDQGWEKLSSAHFDYYYRADEAEPHRVEAALERLEWFWEFVAPAWDYPRYNRITYYKHASPEGLEESTGRCTNGLAILKKSTVHSINYADAHEVAHLFTTRRLFCLFNCCRLSTFWLEGIAMYYSWPIVYFCSASNHIHEYRMGTWYGKSVHHYAQTQLLEGRLMAIRPCIYDNDHFGSREAMCSYPAAGSFITFLLGPGHNDLAAVERFKGFFRRINRASSEDEVARIFEEVYGSPLEEVEGAWHQFLLEWQEPELDCYCSCS